jgi:myo-inositol 2-dehydrogenase/D-chiro-inositol 1-dehydrogenase
VVADTPVRVIVLGAGRIGSLHADVLAHSVPGAELACVGDLDRDRAVRLAERFGVPALPVEDAMRADGDAVAVCTSTDAHVDLIVAAAAAGRQVFCEKPIALDLAEVDRALAATDAAGVLLDVGFNRRFDPSHAAVRAAVTSGQLGEIHLVRITSRDPEQPPSEYIARSGGLFVDMTIHDFDMARFVTGSEVTEVFARGAARIDAGLAEDVDTAVAVLGHEDGTLTTIDNSRHAVYGYDQRVEAFGSGGMASSGNPPQHETAVQVPDGTHGPPLPYFFPERYAASYVRQWEAFVHAVRSRGPAPVDGRDGRAALVLALAAQRSLEERRPVGVDEIG